MINILIRYLGIKTKLLEPIKIAIDDITPSQKGVLDLFAGSSSVGQYLLNDYVVYANDYQEYSYIAAKALIEYHSPETIDSLNTNVVLGDYYIQNKKELYTRFSTPLKEERDLLNNIGEVYLGETFDKFRDYFERSAYIGNTENIHPSFDDCVDYFNADNLQLFRQNSSRFPYSLFTLYYGNPYFSLHQCIEIDSIKYSIDKLYEKKIISEEEKDIYMSFLIYCLNLIVISVGDHFAQPQKIKDVSPDLSGPRDRINLRERKKIITKKRINVIDLFTEKLIDYKSNYVYGDKHNRAFNQDYKELLSSDVLNDLDINTVYIDPPYTNAHYSRFYHIPETLVKYDYPEIEFAGRYRTDRFQSGFCIKSQASYEFSEMLRLCKSKNYNIVISYSDTTQCILSIDEITKLCKQYYGSSIKIDNIDHMYRNFGQKPNRVLAKEYLITCKTEECSNEEIHGE